MRRVIRVGVLGSLVWLCTPNIPVAAIAVGDQAQHVLIIEVSPQSKLSATEEFVKLHNPNEARIDVTGWKLQYRSAASMGDKAWTTKATLGCTEPSDTCQVWLDGHSTLRLGSDESNAGLVLSSGMALGGGQVRLLQPSSDASAEQVQDMVGYGSAATYEGNSAAPAPKAGRSILRKQDANNMYIDTDHNGADFVLADEAEVEASSASEGERGADGSYSAATITEVFPDPASPQLDSTDEFIELYNPHSEPLDLSGYVLKTGATWNHKYVIDNVVVEPYAYMSFSSAQTHLSLSNSGSGVRLYDPNGSMVAEAPSYGKAKTGQSWARNKAGQWVWTTTPTPAAENTIIVAAENVKSAAITTKTTKAAKKSTATPKSKTTSAKPKKTPSAKTTIPGKGGSPAQQAAQVSSVGSPNYLLLVAAGAVAGGYALYEYRQEAAGLIRRVWQVATSGGKK